MIEGYIVACLNERVLWIVREVSNECRRHAVTVWVGLADKEARSRSARVEQKRCVLLLMYNLVSKLINSGHVESMILLGNPLLHSIDTRGLGSVDREARRVTVLLSGLEDLLAYLIDKIFEV